MTDRKYPVGIQTFSEIIRGGYLYVDKTDLVWQLKNYAKFIFMGRPRRFGKSLLTSTLESYFKGEKKLFEGLKIMQMEKEWKVYPVIRLDLSIVKGRDTAEELRQSLLFALKDQFNVYGRNDEEETPGQCLTGMMKRAYEQTGQQVVVIIDEYDAPLLEVLHTSQQLDEMRKVMQEFYQPLKACEAMIKFCFITGITKFSQLSIFSTLNNLTNITMDSRFATICGITETELTTVMREDIGQLAGYTAMVDDLLNTGQDNPSIGLLICKEKNNVLARYALSRVNVPIGISEYELARQQLPNELQDKLPTEAEIEKRLASK